MSDSRRSKLSAIKPGLILLAGLTLSACDDCVTRYEAVYLSYEELRSAVEWQAPKPIQQNGKIITYQHLLLVNEPDKGIHIFDNIAPENPTAIGFINIPGNHDLIIYNDTLYADSYTDLVLIDISDLDNVREVNRQTFVYEYDATLIGPYSGLVQIDPSQGIAIDYTANTQCNGGI